MDLRLTADELAFRDEVRRFCREQIPEHIRRKTLEGRKLTRVEAVTCQRILHARGWSTPLWPVEWGGRNWTATQFYIFREELQQAGVPEAHHNTYRVGQVLLTYGTETQKQRFLPRLGNLDLWFCQGYSEPGSGSDLASLKTSARREGDHYIVTGQKMWTSNAHHADWAYCLVRTNPDAPKKQAGISFMLIDFKSPGITIRPIITIDRRHETNEVFFDDVRVPAENLIGPENEGWNVAKLVLSIERVGHAQVGTSKGKLLEAKRLAAAVRTANGRLIDEQRFRDRVAALEIQLKALEITSLRVVDAEMRRTTRGFDPISAVLKLKGGELQQATAELLMQVAGPYAMVYRPEGPDGEPVGNTPAGPDWAWTIAPNYFFRRVTTIAGGTNEVQRNIIAKSVLGL